MKKEPVKKETDKKTDKNTDNQTQSNRSAVPHILWGLLLISAVAAEVAARMVPGFATWYTRNIYRVLVATWGGLVGLLPWSFAEFSILSMIMGLFVYALYNLGMVIKKERKFTLGVTSWFALLARFLVTCFVIFVFGCGINYYSVTFAESAGYDGKGCTEAELRSAIIYMVDQVNANVDQISFDEKGASIAPKGYMKDCIVAMQGVADNYGVTSSYVPQAKPLLFSRFFSIQLVSGIYLPTIEANFNREQTGEELGFTVCHEMSHLSGYMQEEEANMISYLACSGSDSAYLRYSGAMLALTYLTNAYKGKDESELLKQLDPRATQDMYCTWEHWEQFKKPVATVGDHEIVVSEIHTQINNAYLKANGDEDGVKSFGVMVNLLVEHLRKEGKLNVMLIED